MGKPGGPIDMTLAKQLDKGAKQKIIASRKGYGPKGGGARGAPKGRSDDLGPDVDMGR